MKLGERLNRLEPRERTLLAVLVVVFALLLFAGGPLGLAALVWTRQAHNEELRQAIAEVQTGREKLSRREVDDATVTTRYQNPAPPLPGFLESIAKRNNIEIPESQDRPPVAHGKDYEERSNKLVLRRVDLLSFSKFLEGIEQSGHPLTVSQLNLRKRGGEPNSYDVSMVVSAWDRKERPKKSAGKTGGGEGGAGPVGGAQ
jgi:general secretion pathway protein M